MESRAEEIMKIISKENSRMKAISSSNKHKILLDLFLDSMVDEIKDRVGELRNCSDHEKMNHQLELAELVAYYNDKGFLTPLPIHWPAINDFLDILLELRENKKNRDELVYLKGSENG
jgi:hypothetical protein